MSQRSFSLVKIVACLFGGLLCLACGAQVVQDTFTNEYGCDEHVRVQKLGASRYRASGCGMATIYTCVNRACIKDSEQVDETPTGMAALRAAPNSVGSTRTKRKDSATELKMDVVLGEAAVLRMRASPKTTGEIVQMKILYDGDLTQCDLSWMVNGTKQEVPNGRFKLGRYSTAKIELTRTMMQDLAVAQQMAFKACDKRWSLTAAHLDEIHQFAGQYEEELAWEGPARKGATGGHLAPSGGWPEWTPEGSPPRAAKLARPLDGEALFKLLAPSVVTIETYRGKDEALGSGVAISQTEILTNCHVVEGAKKVLVKQDAKEWVAKVSRSDPGSDRCVLLVSDAKFKPAPGVRSYDDLKVGEPLYTLGSPNGLELSLSSGILSGLRKVKDRAYVQTTAPVSPGSSGGGLFDAHGNVIGITTFIQVDRDRINQSLNFAIPADSYWQP